MLTAPKSPDFFILGAPKCGTTSMAQYLGEHPEICMSQPKEPNFFCSDLDVSRIDAKTVEEYEARCFAHADPQTHRALGEASVWNLYSKLAVPRILSLYPAAKFIVLLRNPVDMAHSLHSQSVFQGHEDRQRFIEAWRLCDKRRTMKELAQPADRNPLLLYDEVCSLGAQVKRLLQNVPKSRVCLVFNDDLQRNTLECYQGVVKFLNLRPEISRTFVRLNEARRVRFYWTAYILRSRLATQAAISIKRITGLRTLGIGKAMPPLRENDRVEVGEFFEPDIRLLSSITGRNLDHWLEKNSGPFQGISA